MTPEMILPWRKRPTLISPMKAISIVERSYSPEGIVGIAVGMTDGEATYLTDLYVIPKYRGGGRGKELVERFLDAARDTTVILLTSEATEFYKKLGFKERTAMVWRKG